MADAKEPAIRRLEPEDAAALCHFYNELSDGSKRLFHPLGEKINEEQCRLIAEQNLPERETKYDLVALLGERVVGWAFLWNDADKPGEASLGIAVTDDAQGGGLGKRLITELLAAAPARGLVRIRLTVVQDNAIARRLYEACGFFRTGSFVGKDGLDYFSMMKEA